MDQTNGDVMSSPLDLSVEAVLELEEFKQRQREDVPALVALFHFIRTPQPAFSGKSISLLDDVRAYPLLRDSLGDRTKKRPTNFNAFKKWVESYLIDLEAGVQRREGKKIEEAKRFCLSLNTHMLARQMNDIYSRRERSEARNFDHESLL
jgi:hypothetical protein